MQGSCVPNCLLHAVGCRCRLAEPAFSPAMSVLDVPVGCNTSLSLMPFLLSAGAPIWFNSPELFNSWQAIRGVDLQGHFDYICPLTNKGRLPNILECQYEGTPQVQHLNTAACRYLTNTLILHSWNARFGKSLHASSALFWRCLVETLLPASPVRI